MARTRKKNLSFGLFSAKMLSVKENIIMGFFSELFFGIMNQSNEQPRRRSPFNQEPTADDYIRSGEIERDNYDDGQRNSINEHGNLSWEREDDERDW